MNVINIGDWVLVLNTGEKLQVLAISTSPNHMAKRETIYITSDGVRHKIEEIEKYVDMSDDFDDMISVVLEHKQLNNIINTKLDSGDFDGLDELVRNKKQLEKKYEDCLKK